jgi:nucleoid-associated protein YgaU
MIRADALPEMLSSVGIFTMEEEDPPRKQKAEVFTAYMTKAPIVVAGYGGWSRVARPRKKAITEWVGRDSISIQIEFLIDSFDEGTGLWVEESCRSLESLAGVESDDPEPPLCILTSVPEALMPHGYHRASHVRWFVDTITWDADAIIYNNAGNRTRAAGTLTVTQFVEDSRLEAIGSKGKGKGRGKGKKKSYIVKPGDTLSTIAARKDIYGNPHKWPRIAKANHIRDPKKLKVGRKLKIP